MISFRVCGPKLSTCCALLSVWGIIQLSFMAIFMYFNSVAFIEDLKLPKGEDEYKDPDELFQDITKGYGETAKNCGIAVALYALTFCISIHQMWINNHFTATTTYVRQYNNMDMQELSS